MRRFILNIYTARPHSHRPAGGQAGRQEGRQTRRQASRDKQIDRQAGEQTRGAQAGTEVGQRSGDVTANGERHLPTFVDVPAGAVADEGTWQTALPGISH